MRGSEADEFMFPGVGKGKILIPMRGSEELSRHPEWPPLLAILIPMRGSEVNAGFAVGEQLSAILIPMRGSETADGDFLLLIGAAILIPMRGSERQRRRLARRRRPRDPDPHEG